jgi:hypothetical protein
MVELPQTRKQVHGFVPYRGVTSHQLSDIEKVECVLLSARASCG